jgi:hypothetical protein
VEATKQKEEKREKPKPEEQESMPQRRHCPPEKRRDCDYGGYGGTGERLLECSTNQIFVHGTSGYGP